MDNIKHIFHINTSFEKVFNAITTVNGLANWWTRDTSGSSAIDDIITFKFGEMAVVQMKVIASDKNKFIKWENTSGMPSWIGSNVSFELSSNDNKVKIKFSHDNFSEIDQEELAAMNFSWGRYLISLRNYCEFGKGDPFKI